MSDDPGGGARRDDEPSFLRPPRWPWDLPGRISQVVGWFAAAVRLTLSRRPAHQHADRPWMRRTVCTDALTDDEYRDFLRSCGHTAARIERGDFLDDEEPDVDLFAEPKS